MPLTECDPSERLSADDMATRREEQFLAHALQRQQLQAAHGGARPGRCANCGEACLPAAVYCDDDCKRDHQERLRRLARQGRG